MVLLLNGISEHVAQMCLETGFKNKVKTCVFDRYPREMPKTDKIIDFKSVHLFLSYHLILVPKVEVA